MALLKRIHSRQSGFTLVELIIVIIVVSTLAGVAVPTYYTLTNRARETGTESMMRDVAVSLELFKTDNNNYPLSDQDTDALEQEGYLKQAPEEDLWENQLIYVSEDGSSYIYISMGVDGEKDTEDDIIFRNGTMVADGGYANSGGGQEAGFPVLFASDFGNMENFFPIMGDWDIDNNLLKPSTKKWQNRIVFGDLAWSDYQISVNAELKKGNGYGIYYRSNNVEKVTGYIFQYDPGLGNKFVVRKVTNGMEAPPFQKVDMPDGFKVYDQDHNITISLEGDRHIIKVDDEVVFDFHDEWRDEGMAGFRSWSRSDVGFSDLNVTEIP